MEVPSFIFGGGAPAKTPQEAARNRAVYESIVARMSRAPRDVGEGLSSVGNALVARTMMDRASQGEEAGQARVAELLGGLQDGADQGELMTALSDPWFSENKGGSLVAQALLNKEMQGPQWQTLESGGDVYRWDAGDPNSTPSLFFDGPDSAADRPYEEDQFGVKRYIDTGESVFPDVQAPVDAKEVVAEGRRTTATDTIVGAASRARELAKNEGNVGMSGAAWGWLSESEAAELRRQVDVLKSTASIENLTAMRQASPTGGALGSVSEKENAMLAAASGAIDPNSRPEDFNRQLDDYERTLLRIVHGPAEGDRIFAETRAAEEPSGDSSLDDLVKKYGG